MDEKQIKQQIIDSFSDISVPNVKARVLEQYQAKHVKKTPWYQRKSFYIPAPLLACGIALAIVLPSTLKNGGSKTLEIEALKADKQVVAFNLTQASNALSVLTGEEIANSNSLRSVRSPKKDEYKQEDYQVDCHNMFDVLNPYMGTISSLIYEEQVADPEIYISSNPDYDYSMDNLLFNITDNGDGTYKIEGILEGTDIQVSGGKFVDNYRGANVSAIMLDFTYSEDKTLRFTGIDFSDEREFVNPFSGETVTESTSLKYYEYALYSNHKLESFVSIDYFKDDFESDAFIQLNVPLDGSYVNADICIYLDEAKLVGEFDLIRDNRGGENPFDDEPFNPERGGQPGDHGPKRDPEGPKFMFGRIRGEFDYQETDEAYIYNYNVSKRGNGEPPHGPSHDDFDELVDEQFAETYVIQK